MPELVHSAVVSSVIIITLLRSNHRASVLLLNSRIELLCFPPSPPHSVHQSIILWMVLLVVQNMNYYSCVNYYGLSKFDEQPHGGLIGGRVVMVLLV